VSVLAIALLTIQEAARRRLLLALVLLTVLAVGLTGFGFSRIPLIQARGGVPLGQTEVFAISAQLLILVMFMFSFVLALSAVFMATPAVSSDLESGVALAMVARPVRRADFALGKWLGLAALVVAYAVLSVTLELLVVRLGTGYSPPDPPGIVAFLVGEGLVLLTLGLLLSTRASGMVGGVIALVLFGLAWLAGIVGGIGTALSNDAIAQVGTVSRFLLPTDGLWRGAVYSLVPAVMHTAIASGPAAVAAATPFYAAAPPPPAYLAWCAAWVAGMLGLAVRSLNAKDL